MLATSDGMLNKVKTELRFLKNEDLDIIYEIKELCMFRIYLFMLIYACIEEWNASIDLFSYGYLFCVPEKMYEGCS